PRAARLSEPPSRRPPARVGADDRRTRLDRRVPPPATGAGGPGSRVRRRAAGLPGASRPDLRPASEGTSRGDPPLRLRPPLRPDRLRARLEHGGRPASRLVRGPSPAPEGVAMTLTPELDLRFREAAAAAGLLDVAYDVTDSPIGDLLVAATERGLCNISFDPDEATDRLARAFGRRVLRVPSRLDGVRRQLDEYFEGRREAFELEPDISLLPPFQQLVLTELAQVPYGRLTTYGALAGRIGRPRAARAVGGALNRNPIPIVLPCHRVVGASGSLTGYAGGLHVKQQLLELEHALLTPPDR